MRKSTGLHLLAVCGFIGIIFWLFWDVLNAPDGQMIVGYDISHYYYFMKSFLKDSIQQRNIPWWNPYAFSGMPFLANPQQASLLYPPTWLFLLLPLAKAFTVYIPTHLVLAMIGMYVFTYTVTHDRIAAWISGITYGLSGYFMARMHVGHVDMIAASSILPWTVAASLRTVKTGRFKITIVTSVLLTLEFFAGYPTVALFTVGFLVVLSFYYGILNRSVKPLVRIGTALVLFCALSAVQLIPAVRFMRSSTRTIPVSYQWAATGSVVREQLRELVYPPDVKNGFVPAPDYPERGVYMGRIILILALITCIISFKKTGYSEYILLFELVALGAIWVSMGEYAPVNLFRILWDTIPFYKQLRYPPRHLVLFVLSVSLIGGIGIRMIRNRMVKYAILVCIFLELIPYHRGYIVTQQVPEALHNRALIKFLQSAGYYRTMPFIRQLYPPEEFVANTPSLYRIFSAGGSESGMMRNYYEFTDAVSGVKQSNFIAYETDSTVKYVNYRSPYFDFLSIRYLLTFEGGDTVDTSDGKYRIAWSGGKPLFTVYENSTVLPRFRTIPAIEIFSTRNEVIERVASGLHNPRNSVLLVGSKSDYPASDCSGTQLGTVQIKSYSANRITLSVNMPCDGYLTSSEVHYPEWYALVDGKKSAIYEGNLAFRTLYLTRGMHNVEFRYVPSSFYAGAVISMITVAFISAMLLRVRIKRRYR